MRLAKYLSRCGVASRRASDEIIRSGRVTVAGMPVTDPARDVEALDAVAVDGEIVTPEEAETWALHKPLGVVSTANDPQGRPKVVDLVQSSSRLYPVGRLDADSTGLILLSNDGPLANHLTHPRYEVPKTYSVVLSRAPTPPELKRLRSGPVLDDGPTHPLSVRRIGRLEVEVEVEVGEGRNRQLRRMVEAVGNEVAALRRVRFGSLDLGTLAEGKARRLGRDEIAGLWEDGSDERG